MPLKIEFLNLKNWSRLKTLLLKHFYRRQGLRYFGPKTAKNAQGIVTPKRQGQNRFGTFSHLSTLFPQGLSLKIKPFPKRIKVKRKKKTKPFCTLVVARFSSSKFWPFIRRSARTPTIRAARGTTAVQGKASHPQKPTRPKQKQFAQTVCANSFGLLLLVLNGKEGLFAQTVPKLFAQTVLSGPQKGPAERGHVKKRQKSSKSVKNIFDTFRQFSRRAKNVKNRQKVSKYFSTLFDNFCAAPVFRPLLGGSESSFYLGGWFFGVGLPLLSNLKAFSTTKRAAVSLMGGPSVPLTGGIRCP